MEISKCRSRITGFLTFLLLVVLDQCTKRLAVAHLKDQEPMVIIENVFQLRYLENRGAAFGILQGQRIAFIVITLIVIAAVFYCYWNIPYTCRFRLLRIIMVFICAGAIGNCIDRSVQGYVVDFFYFILIDFPIFNVADIYVTCAAVALVLTILFYYKEEDLDHMMKSLRSVRKKQSR